MSLKTTGKIVSHFVDLDKPHVFTAEQEAELDKLREMKDEDIDFSDIPAAPRGAWTRMGNVREVIERRMKEMEERERGQTERLLDTDVLQFFQESGDVSPKRINAVLREYVAAQRKTA